MTSVSTTMDTIPQEESLRLADALRRALRGPMWHGPAIEELLGRVDATSASAAPIAGAHSIWGLVLHLTVWVDVARRRLRGTAYEPSLADDFPVLPEISAMSWRAAITRLRDAIEALAVATEGLGIDQLESLTPGHDYTIRLMLLGVVEHAAYHGGQIALLTRANAAARP